MRLDDVNQTISLSLSLPPGLSPDLQSMEQIRRVMRPTDVPDQGLLCDLLWADPDKDVLGWGENDRGVSFTFGADVVAKFLHKHDMDLICRAHQVPSTPPQASATVHSACAACLVQPDQAVLGLLSSITLREMCWLACAACRLQVSSQLLPPAPYFRPSRCHRRD